MRFTLEGVYSLNLHQQTPLDLNFAPVTRFALASEDNRPIYAAASSIVPATGALTNHDSRLDAAFGSVNAIKTDLRSHTRQLIFTVFPAPGDALGRFTQWQAAYALQDIREEARGFGGTTGGNPLDVQRTRGSFESPPSHVLVRDARWVVVLGEHDGARRLGHAVHARRQRRHQR